MVAIILVILTLFGMIFVFLPIFLGKKEKTVDQNESNNEDRISKLNEHKKILFSLLKDLEFEYKTGKISNADFDNLYEEYKNKVILIYQEMDKPLPVVETAPLEPDPTTIINNG